MNEFERLNRALGRKRGLVLTWVLIILALGSLVVSPLLIFIGSGLNNTRNVYEKKTDELYAADSGIEDARWLVKYDKLGKLTDPVPYDEYDYSTAWEYDLNNDVNGKAVHVSLQNVWIPSNLPPPGVNDAHNIADVGKLVVTGSAKPTADIAKYTIKITYNSTPAFQVESIGVWLPSGYAYYSDASHKSDFEGNTSPHWAMPAVTDYGGNESVIWTFGPNATFEGFPQVSGSQPKVMEASFWYRQLTAGPPYDPPGAIAWINTADGAQYGVPFSWDADVKVFYITSTSTSPSGSSTRVESYTAKSELRHMQSAINGDYFAAGNSALSAVGSSVYRTDWHDPSTATVSGANIPDNAEVAGAYLYWSGWKNDSNIVATFPADSGDNFNKWWNSTDWTIDASTGNPGSSFKGNSANSTGILELKDFLDLSSVSSGGAYVSWDQTVQGASATDGLDFSFSADGGSTWSSSYQAFRGNIGTSWTSFSYTIPNDYLTAKFKVRLSLVGFTAARKCYIDNIKVSSQPPDKSVVFKINDQQVYFDDDGIAHQGTTDLSASRSQVLRNYSGTSPHGFSYSSFCDVTELVRKYSTAVDNGSQPDNYPGYGVYSVGGIYASTPRDGQAQDEWAYANWSILIIYTSPDNLGHQLFLFDDFIYSNHDSANGINVDFDKDGQPGGTISGFLVPNQVVQAVTSITLNSGGSGYTSVPAVQFDGGGGSGAAAMVQLSGTSVNKITITNGGTGYTSAPTISFVGGEGSGAIATATVGNEVNAAKLTYYVGEGDNWYGNDYVAMNGVKLWDGTTDGGNSKGNPTNTFNSASMGVSTFNGIDIDTLGIDPPNGQYITWNSGILKAGDASAKIDMVTHNDVWNMIYLVLSFRSVTSTGGALSYLIK